MTAREKALVMTADDIERALERLAAEIAASEPATDTLMLVGIRTRGVPLARRLADLLKRHYARDLPVGILDITFYRDDLSRIAPHPVVKTSERRATSPVASLCSSMMCSTPVAPSARRSIT
jgi:pyrimidine operon attenuation protein/uracil phosphoribosyltransferase